MNFIEICEKLEDQTIQLRDLRLEDPLFKMRHELHQKIEKLDIDNNFERPAQNEDLKIQSPHHVSRNSYQVNSCTIQYTSSIAKDTSPILPKKQRVQSSDVNSNRSSCRVL